MTRQIPPALCAAIIIICTFALVGVISQTAPRASIAGQRVENGGTLFDFSGTTTTGETFKMSDHKGKVVLLNFWATWCGPCVQETPDLVKLQETFGPKGFQIVGLSQDDNLEVATEFAKEHNMNYPVLLVPSEVIQNITTLGGIRALPTSILINKEGKVVWRMEGVNPAVPTFEVISNELKSLL